MSQLPPMPASLPSPAPSPAPSSPPLPALSPHPAPGSAPRISLTDLKINGDQNTAAKNDHTHWSPGLSALLSDPNEPFTRPCDPLPLTQTQWLAVSESAAAAVGLQVNEITQNPAWLNLLSGNAALKEHQPYAAVYAGHQFGSFVPRLGDGRALNLGTLAGLELQLKGAGPTPYSRFADGRAVLRSSIREFLCSEAMHGLGIPTTRALSIVTSPAGVIRETLETAAVVCRLAPNFVRFGSFEYFAAQNRPDLIEKLLTWVLPSLKSLHNNSFYGLQYNLHHDIDELIQAPAADQAVALLEIVAARTARLMAHWMSVGFMHGVMNTDNFSVLGLTLDYGPFGFMEAFNAQHVCNHTDYAGRYSYQNQPQVGLWNVARLATALNLLVNNPDRLQPALEIYKAEYEKAMTQHLRAKFGLAALDQATWSALLDDFYQIMHTQAMDYTLAFRALAHDQDQPLLDLASDQEALKPWLTRYRTAVAAQVATGQTKEDRRSQMNRVNPKFVLRNWVAQEVIESVQKGEISSVFQEVFTVLQNPFDEHPTLARYAQKPPDWAENLAVSCSS